MLHISLWQFTISQTFHFLSLSGATVTYGHDKEVNFKDGKNIT